ncbi:MAG TPA: hypothetical protein PLT47_10985 [Bacteroidales bacterium]|nr:hypothetical protein [Bacteroidales bacterium]
MFKTLSSIEVKDIDSKGRITVAANCLGNVDSQKDISMEGSFNKTIKDNFYRLKWYQNHDTTLLLGVPIEAKEVYPHLQVTGQLNMEKQISRDIYSDYKLYAEHGKTLEHSIGVEAVKKDIKDGVRRVFEWKWWEYSTLTNWGANENTPLIAMKDMASVAASIDWLEIKLRKGDFSDEKFLSIEKQLNVLKSLVTEPDEMDCPNCKAKNPNGSTSCKSCNHDLSTQMDEPMKALLPFAEVLKSFNQKFKTP